ncbi:MAG TPA: hypothetical protein VMW12_07515 [Candidatus Dormibacteraeota bacterium]|nr:hypothetical protein [Candidatus Dormibacteraeota bacterium]
MSQNPITYTSSAKPIGSKALVCKRCQRKYAYPHPGERPIRCECGWWYYNDGAALREAYWQRIEPYRMPPDFAHLFPAE